MLSNTGQSGWMLTSNLLTCSVVLCPVEIMIKWNTMFMPNSPICLVAIVLLRKEIVNLDHAQLLAQQHWASHVPIDLQGPSGIKNMTYIRHLCIQGQQYNGTTKQALLHLYILYYTYILLRLPITVRSAAGSNRGIERLH